MLSLRNEGNPSRILRRTRWCVLPTLSKGTELRIVLRNRVSRTPNGEPRRWTVRAGLPDAAAGLPGVVLILPRLAAGIAGLGHDVPPPEFFASAVQTLAQAP